MQTPDTSDRYMLVSFDGRRYAIPLKMLERVVANTRCDPWIGRGDVKGSSHVAGWMVWILDASQVFVDFEEVNVNGSWLLVLKEELGLSRVGVLADDIKGPVSQSKLQHIKRLQRRSLEMSLDQR